jgi:glycine cleavage system H protein
VSADNYPEDLQYHPEHDWARIEGDQAEFGITWHAQDALGDVVFFDPPEIGTTIDAGGSYGELESVKAVSDLIAPLSGEVLSVNKEVVEQPELVNGDPYSAWLVRVKLTHPDQADELLSADAYQKLL